MKIQLDTTKKIITLEEGVNLEELFALLENILPEGKWKEFKLKVTTIFNWSDPIIIERPIYYPPVYVHPITPVYPYYPPYRWISPFTTGGGTGTGSITMEEGVFNIETKI